jgi:hypothetical protein
MHRLVFYFNSYCVVVLADTFLSFFPLSSFVAQDLPGYLRRLYNRAMILY